MTKQNETVAVTLEKAPEAIPFLKGEYFEGLCEIASACMSKAELYIPERTNGIFQSLYFKRVFARQENANGSWTVGEFDTNNRFLYNYDRVTRTYGAPKQDNIVAFKARVKELIEKKDYQVFSLKPIQKADDLSDFLGM